MGSYRETFERILTVYNTALLKKLLEGIREAMAEDDAIPEGERKKFGVREFGDFRDEADAIEALLRARGEDFVAIDWRLPHN